MLEIKQYIKMSHQLVMTPQLQQAIKILQLTRSELRQEIEKQVGENPCLEQEYASDLENEKELEQLVRAATDNQNDYGQWARSEARSFPSYEQFVTKIETLWDHLEWQLRHTHFSSKERQIAETIVGNIDENGFLSISLEALVDEIPGVGIEDVEPVLYVIQQFDPVGVGSRDLRECLLNQLWSFEVKTPEVRLATRMLEDCFEDFFHRRIKTVEKKLGVSSETVRLLYRTVAQLNPKPGSMFHCHNALEGDIQPDVFVRQMGDEFAVQTNESGFPRLKVSRTYLKLVSERGTRQEREYVKEKLRNALWFMKSIEQRNSTLLKVVRSLLRFQNDFFLKGPLHLRPLVLREVAEDIGMHESTISRVSRGKYLQTPFGLVELKYFFSPGISTREDAIASRSVKHIIRELVSSENPRCPLSDQQICELLGQRHIRIARRTVAKYRETLGILPSSGRVKKF